VPKADLLYESNDWPVAGSVSEADQKYPDTGVVVFDNVRL